MLLTIHNSLFYYVLCISVILLIHFYYATAQFFILFFFFTESIYFLAFETEARVMYMVHVTNWKLSKKLNGVVCRGRRMSEVNLI